MKLVGTLKQPVKLQGGINPKEKMTGFINPSSQVLEKDYNNLENKPSIENVELVGNKTFEDLGLKEITGRELIDIFEEVWR